MKSHSNGSFFHVDQSDKYPSVEDDRIVYQAEHDQFEAAGTLTINVVRSSRFAWDEPEFTRGFQECPTYKNCKVRTLDGAHWLNDGLPEADGTVVADMSFGAVIPRLSNQGGRNTIIYFNLENPFYHPLPLSIWHYDHFRVNLTMTYKHDSDIVTPYGKWAYHNATVRRREQQEDKSEGKTRDALMK